MAITTTRPTVTHAGAAVGLALANAAQRFDVDPMPLTRGAQMELARGMALLIVEPGSQKGAIDMSSLSPMETAMQPTSAACRLQWQLLASEQAGTIAADLQTADAALGRQDSELVRPTAYRAGGR